MLIMIFFSSKLQDVKVTLTNKDNNKIEWVGYTTPCIYSQGWTHENELLQLELIDGISTLENYEYIQSNTKKQRTFHFLILSKIQLKNVTVTITFILQIIYMLTMLLT